VSGGNCNPRGINRRRTVSRAEQDIQVTHPSDSVEQPLGFVEPIHPIDKQPDGDIDFAFLPEIDIPPDDFVAPPDIDIPPDGEALLHYKEPAEPTLECEMCYEDKPLAIMSICKNNHQICEECTKAHLKYQVEVGSTYHCCPGLNCDEVLSEAEVRLHLGAEKFQKHESRVQERCIGIAAKNGDLEGYEKCPNV
jgi:hypothetical protein